MRDLAVGTVGVWIVPGPRGELAGAGVPNGALGWGLVGRGIVGLGTDGRGVVGVGDAGVDPGTVSPCGGEFGVGGPPPSSPPELGGGGGGQPWAKASAVALRARIVASASFFMWVLYPA